MARVKRGTKRRARRKKYLKRTKGFFLTKSKLYQSAQEAANRADRYAFRDRRNKKRQYRRLWIQRSRTPPASRRSRKKPKPPPLHRRKRRRGAYAARGPRATLNQSFRTERSEVRNLSLSPGRCLINLCRA